MKGKLPKGQHGKLSKQMLKQALCLLLSGMLVVTGVQVPTTVYAAEDEIVNHETTDDGAAQESTASVSLDEAETSSDNTQAESETNVTQQQTEEQISATEQQTESEQVTDEQQTESETSAGQQDSTASEESNAEDEEGNSESSLESEVSEETTDVDFATETESEEGTLEDNEASEVFEERSFIVVNPLYEGIIDPDELAEQLKPLQIKSLNDARSTAESFQTFEAAAEYLRGQMVARAANVSIQVPLSVAEANDAQEGFVKTLLAAAITHTEECTGQEGDALAWQYGGAQMSMSSSSQTYTVNYTILYYTTQEQEQELTTKVNEAIDSLALSDKTNYQKVKAIHDYICDNVDYDYENLENQEYKIKFTAYGALCTGKAVCQGYAVLFYRMCKEAGLPVRIITGIGNGGPHAWNIVKLGLKYYNIDCTWDGQDETTRHTYFLLNEEDFEDHTRDDEYATEAFNAQYPMAAVSYIDESAFEASLNKDNPTATFTTLDDETVSSEAEGKPKLLVFFRTTCGNSMNTIKSIAGHDFSGVDIYAVEIDGKAKEEVSDFQKTYGGDNIVFSYDTTDKNSNNMWNYVRAAGINTSAGVGLPVLCYIDMNNKLQYITQGVQNAGTIEANLNHYCGAALVEQYKITYVLDGGTNDSSNPSTYQKTSDTIVLKAPTKTGYTFVGWYIDPAFAHKVTQIDPGNSGDITLYAKWEVIEASDKLNLDNLDIDFTTLEDEYVSSTANGKPKLLIFFSSNCGNSQRTIQGIAQQGLQNVDVYAIETIGSSKETVQAFKDQYGSDAIVFSYDNYGYENNSYLNQYVDLANHDSITPPTICYIDANNKLQHITNGYSSVDAIKANLDAYCAASATAPSETYTITYVLDGGVNNSNNPDTYTSETDTITLENPTKEGYSFAGWYLDEAFTEPVTQIKTGSSGNVTLYAKWEIGSDEEPKPDVLGNGTTITLNQDVFTYNGKEQKPEVTVQHIDQILVLNEDYTLTYKDNLNAGTAAVTVTGIKDYQGAVTMNFAILPAKLVVTAMDKTLRAGDSRPAPDGYDYQVEGLADGENLLTPPTFMCNVPNPVQAGEYEIIPSGAKAGTNYDANITYQNGRLLVVDDISGYIVTFNVQGHGTAPQPYIDVQSGETIAKPADPSAEGYWFDGWYQDADCKIVWNFETDVVTADITLYAKWVKNTEIEDDNNKDKDDSRYPSDKRTDLQSIGGKIAEIKSKVYDGNPYMPTVKVTITDGNKQVKLTEGADYRVLYENNVNAGLGKVIVRGNGIYKGEITKEFNITKKKVKKLKVITGGVAADVKSNLPVYVYDGTKLLNEGTDYVLSDLTDVKTASAKVTITATESSNYEGSVKASIALYNVEASRIIHPENVTLNKETAVYTGKAITSIVPEVKLDNETVLVKNKDYKVQYKNNTNAGDAYVIITGKGQYKGKVVKSFTITASKSELTIKDIPDKTYNGKLQKPTVTVKAGTKKLKANKDYTITYENNFHEGAAVVRITGKGNYAGVQADTQFVIKPQKISKASVKGNKATGITLTYNKKLLGEGIDYTLAYGEEKNGKIQVHITGKGDFTGEVTKSVKSGVKESDSNASPAVSKNKGKQNYTRWAAPMTSYLANSGNNTVTRVEYINDKVYVETYSLDQKLLNQKEILMELPLFGGFYAGKDNYFLVFGQTNAKENDNTEVIRVVKYDKNWKREGAASLRGANTTTPFNAGSLRMVEYGGMLYVRTCHTMYKSGDGLNHQANLTFSVRTSDMEITDQLSNVWNIAGGYVSHSFNQFTVTDGSDLLAVDHGDAYPRSVVLVKYSAKVGADTFTGHCDNVNVLPIQGGIGNNDTGVSVGGMEVSETAYLVAGNSVAQDDAETYNASGVRNIFVTSTQKNNFTSDGTTIHWITNYTDKSAVTVSTPQMVKVKNNEFLLMWTEGEQVRCVLLNASGEPITGIYGVKGALSDCQPILLDGYVLWYYTDSSKPVFCSFNIEDVRKQSL